ncbi:odontogenic ameloblast-associated protein [Leptonychotes weddellii]|uniref:Odontogenic ameloblast-associated protein n=1 Tax=Leptonychotes weddellii TaxID=9713 RepID=A0A2U3XD41_LEPWE|nr:odontogenic ameloblast-associated protein [Leptonychotes weddellii]
MKTIILLGLLGATMSAPLIPQHLMSASNSNELLLSLNNAQLQPLQLQGPFNLWIPPFSGILQQQQQAQIPGLSQFSLPALDWFAGLLPNQVPFPGRVSFAQGTQVGQLDASQPQTPPQTQQGPNHPAGGVIPYLQKEVINFKHASGGIFIPSTSQKSSTTNSFAPAIDPTITPELMEKKAKTDYLKEP